MERLCSRWVSSASALKLVWFIVPLTAASGLLALICSNWVFTTPSYPFVWSYLSPPPPPPQPPSERFMNSNITKLGPLSRDESEAHIERQPREVVNEGEASSSPPLAIEDKDIQAQAVKKEERLSGNTSELHNTTSRNESSINLPIKLKRKNGNLEKIEAGLAQARATIREARNNGNQPKDPDYLPTGPIYLNANAFHRSYLEMEKQFKVFVYEEGEHPIFHNGPCRSIYAMEGNFIYQMEISRFRTTDPNKAHAFFLPFSVTALVRFVYNRNSHDWAPMKQTVRDYVSLLAGKYHFWNRSLGADHFMLSCHDWGPELSTSVPDLRKNSIRALCNANTSEGFLPAKDVSFPEILLPDGTMRRLLGGPSPSRRSILAFFAGGVHGPVRPILLEHWENKDQDIQVHKYLPKNISYYDMLRKSRFCICPSGYEVASPRMVEALYTGCVPVLIKDHYVAPFSDVLNWKSFSVEVPVKDIPNLKKILMAISQRQYIRMHRRGLQVRRHFEVNFPPKRFDVFHMILHSIWLRRLNVRIYDTNEVW